MHAPRTPFLATLLALLAISYAAAQNSAPSPRDKAARQFLEQLTRGEFDKATADFDATMQKVMPADELKAAWQKTLDAAGAFKQVLTGRLETKGKYELVELTCAFANGKWNVRVAFDKEAKITGLLFTPTPRPAPTGVEEIYEGPLKIGATDIRLVFHLFKQKDGSYAGTFDSPGQGAKGLVFDEVAVKDNAVRLELRIAKIVFEGKRDQAGQELAGAFKQAGLNLPLTLKRVAKATEARRPQLPRPPFPYDAIEVRYDSKQPGIKLAGTLTLPRGTGPFPAVVLITGSGPQDRDETLMGHKPFLVLADYLTRHGIAVLRVDDRGVGGSTGNVNDATTADFARDVRAGVELLRARKEINPAQVGLIGHSEGGIVAPLVASQTRDVAFIVLLAGTGLPGEEVLYEQGQAILKLAGATKEQLALQRAMQSRLFAVLREEPDPAAADKKLRAVLKELASKLGKGEQESATAALAIAEGQLKTIATPWFRQFLTFDPRPALRKVTCPVLALNGEKDVQVDARSHLPAIAAALKEANNKDVTVRALPNLNHLFQTCRTGALAEYSEIEETLAPVVLETIAEWIRARTGERSQ